MSISMSNLKWLFLLLLLAVGILIFSSWTDEEQELAGMPEEVDFSYHIQPILSQNCYPCHGNDPSTRKAGLRLDLEDDAKALLESGSHAIVGKNLTKSILISRVLSDDPSIQMPPPEAKKTLTAREIALLKKWIKQGAKYQKHWAFTKPVMPTIPKGASNVAEVIDHFVDQKLEYLDLQKVKPASKNELLRRVAYLATGLPPEVTKLESFLQDDSNDAYSKIIDHYLASNEFGERWARHWMDLVRYGESMGHEMDFDISHAFEYRDYLIRAFNKDVPYDLFVKEHLAGDMLETPRLNPDQGYNESHIGTGYFFLGEGKHSPVDPKLEELDRIDNMIDVTSKTFQAMTVACSKCHDHKFDPIPTSDYYSMYGMFESSRLMPRPARLIPDLENELNQIDSIKGEAKDEIVAFLETIENAPAKNEGPVASKDYTPYISKTDTSATMLAEFRDGNWDGWFTEGNAFGDEPTNGELAIHNEQLFRRQNVIQNRKRYKSDKAYREALRKAEEQKSDDIKVELLSGFVSSRKVGAGQHGVLHSPNFTIEHDTIAVRARGLNGSIRVIIDNFQVIQKPLWGGCSQNVTSQDWKTYKLDVHLAKGHKAYLEFMPGKYERHVYSTEINDYIELKWAASFSGDHKLSRFDLAEPKVQSTAADLVSTTMKLEKGEINSEEAKLINQALWSNAQFSYAQEFHQKLETAKEKLFDPTHFIGMSEGEAIESPVFIRGSHKETSEETVPHRFLSAVEVDAEFPQDGSGRLAWANTLVHPDNPLTSRVIVNRVWHHLFGKGIVETVDNFGLQGKIPTHPELLDYLAIQFVEDGWSIKRLIKNIMLSSTFMRSTKVEEHNHEADPENIYLSSFPVRRLESEAIRDGMLAVTGCLDHQMFGEGIPVFLSEFMTGRGRPVVSGPMDSYGRRSIYRQVRRNFIPEMMLAFDMPVPFSTFGRRNTTNVPAQSLALMNNPFVHEQAEYWAENLIFNTVGSTTEERIEQIYLNAFSRLPNKNEISRGVDFLAQQAIVAESNLAELKDDPTIWKEYCHSIFNLKEFIHLL